MSECLPLHVPNLGEKVSEALKGEFTIFIKGLDIRFPLSRHFSLFDGVN